jgi:hypothetical protein
MTMDKQQLWWQRGNNGAATNSKQQSTNAQHAQHSRMRWRTTAAEEMRGMEQRTSNYGRWQRGNNNADNNDKNSNQQMCNGRGRERVRGQRRRTNLAGKRRGAMVEVEEHLLCGGGGETGSP